MSLKTFDEMTAEQQLAWRIGYDAARSHWKPEIDRLRDEVAYVIPAALVVVEQWRDRNPFVGYAIEELAHKLEGRFDE